jgi:hypothetical protein
MMKSLKKPSVIILSLFLQAAPLVVTAFSPTIEPAKPVAVLKEVGHIKTKILCPFLDLIFTTAIIVSIIMIIIAAFKYITASGDTEKFSQAHKSLIYASVGIAVAILAGGVPYIIGSFFEGGVDLGASMCS